MNYSVVIPSKNPENCIACVRAVASMEPDANIIIVDDGARAGAEPVLRGLRYEGRLTWAKGLEPFIYARNCNIGIRVAPLDHAVILLNDDALLTTPGGFTAMVSQFETHPEYGVVSAVTNNVGNARQLPNAGRAGAGDGLRDEPTFLCFVCVAIARATLNQVGFLDERFTEYGSEDVDYSYRALQAGLKLGIFDGCVMEHGKLQSTFRKDGPRPIRPGQQIFMDKHGHGVTWGR